jgi:hemerythrin
LQYQSEGMMEKFEWNDDLTIGFNGIDQHHMHLFGLFKKAHDEFANGAPNLEPIFDELIDYTKYHFKSEEIWMMEKFYPEVKKNQKEHSSFLFRLKSMQNSFKSGQVHMSMEILLFLEEAFVHIRTTDAEFGNFIKEAGVIK